MNTAEHKTLRVAAIGDLHVGSDRPDTEYVALCKELNTRADVLVLCGDLTNTGTEEEAKRLADILRVLSIPVVGVLGNHDYESGMSGEVEKILEGGGLHDLQSRVFEVSGVGFAGVKGFGGGFGKFMLGAFGERAIKQFVDESVKEALLLENSLHQLTACERVVVALHYSPIQATIESEPREIFPFLGSSRLEETIDRFDNVRVVFHGHSHNGVHTGKTGKGIPVYNAAVGVKKHADLLYTLVEI